MATVNNSLLRRIIAIIKRAESDLGPLEFGPTIDLIADNMPSLPLDDCKYAATITRMVMRGEVELLSDDVVRITDIGRAVLAANSATSH